jgi:hypothetical protein
MGDDFLKVYGGRIKFDIGGSTVICRLLPSRCGATRHGMATPTLFAARHVGIDIRPSETQEKTPVDVDA